MAPLPDCPFCNAADTLTPVNGDFAGSIWCVCSCCARTSLVKDGRVVYPVPRTDVSRNQMDGP